MQDILIARQPIFDCDLNLVSYELLFRSANLAKNQQLGGDSMTAQVMVTALIDIGIDKLANGKRVNINATESLLLDSRSLLDMLPPDIIGIEILEDVEINDNTVNACLKLQKKGFTILLDDVVYHPRLTPLLEIADVIKVDLPLTENLAKDVRILRTFKAKLLAEKVETLEDYELVKSLDFDYVQGYFFSKPETVQGRKLPDSKLAILRAMQKIMSATVISDIHEVIKQDVSLSYRLLKYINSAAFGLRRPVKSIEQALALLGLNNIRRWISMLSLATLGEHKSRELFRLSFFRGQFLELLAKARHQPHTEDAFLLGMFSILDALLDVSMEQALESLFLPERIELGLTDPTSEMGSTLHLCKSIEVGDIEAVQLWQEQHQDITTANILEMHHEATLWADAQMAQFV
ncbi:MAG: HDOD domain-containing protein [Ghiorsea sp.]